MVRHMKILLSIFCLLILVSCSPTPEIPPIQLVVKQGIVYEVNSTTPFTGSSVSYHENGQLSTKVNLKNGIPDGLWEGFYENGQLKERGNIKDLEQDGLWEYFDDGGNLTKTEEYKGGELIK